MINKMTGSQGLSFLGLTGVAIGSTIASGVFTLPGDMAYYGAGTAAVLAGWGVCGVGMLALTMCFFGLNKARPELTGGIYSYGAAGWGDYVGFNSAWGYWLSALLANVSFATLLFSSIGYFLPMFGAGNNLASIIAASIIIWITVILVLRGVKQATMVNLVATFAKLIPILTFAIAVIFVRAFDPDVFMSNFYGEDTGLSFGAQIKATTYTTVWSFIGIEGAVAISGRARHSKDVGKATITAFLCVLAIYVMVSVLSMGIMTRAELAALGNPPLAGVFSQAVGSWGAAVVSIGVIVSLLGATLGYTIIAAECAYQAAEKGSFCRAFAIVNKNNSPVFSLIVTNIIIQVFLVVLYFNDATYQIFYTISASMIMVPYLLSAMYYLKVVVFSPNYLRRKEIARPMASVVAVLGTAYGLWLLYSSGLVGVLISALLYAPGTLVYMKGKKERGQKSFDNPRDIILLIVILAMFVASIIMIGNGTIHPFS